MSKYIHTLFVSISLLLFGMSVSFGDDASYRQPAGGGCWWVCNYESTPVSWDLDCGELPEIEVVAATPPPDEDVYHNVGEPWWHVDLFGTPYRWNFPQEIWEEIAPAAMPLEVIMKLAPSQLTTIDCAPVGNSDIRKRDLFVWTKPIFNDLEITSITRTREYIPYGHHHTPDNNVIRCRGATSVDDGSTNDNGVFQFFYRGPEAAGRTVVAVFWQDPRDEETGSVSMTFENRHDGLVEMTGTPAMTLTGHESDDFHLAPDIHWVTPTTQTRIEFLAALYYAEYNENLKVNDGSLRYGGLYDYNETWAPPHSEHREGKNVDIYPTTVSNAKWDFLRENIVLLGNTYHDETDEPPRHLHFRE